MFFCVVFLCMHLYPGSTSNKLNVSEGSSLLLSIYVSIYTHTHIYIYCQSVISFTCHPSIWPSLNTILSQSNLKLKSAAMSTTGRMRPFFTYTGGRIITEQTDNDCREMSEERESCCTPECHCGITDRGVFPDDICCREETAILWAGLQGGGKFN